MSIKTPTEILRSFKYTLNNAIKKDLSKIEELQLNAEFNKELNKQINTYKIEVKKYKASKTSKAQQKKDFIDQQSAISYNMMLEDQRRGHEEDAKTKEEQAKINDAINSINLQEERQNGQGQAEQLTTKQYSIYNNEKYPVIECLKPFNPITIEKIEQETRNDAPSGQETHTNAPSRRPKKYKVKSKLSELSQKDMQEALNRALINV